MEFPAQITSRIIVSTKRKINCLLGFLIKTASEPINRHIPISASRGFIWLYSNFTVKALRIKPFMTADSTNIKGSILSRA
jgi:hypothetical protein